MTKTKVRTQKPQQKKAAVRPAESQGPSTRAEGPPRLLKARQAASASSLLRS